MSPIPPDGPVARGRRSQTLRWHDVLPTGPPLNGGQELFPQHFDEVNNRPRNGAGRATIQVGPAPGAQTPRHNLLRSRLVQSQAPELQAPRPQTPSNAFRMPWNRPRTPLTRPQTPLNRARTPLNQSLTPSNRSQTPSSRPQTPQSQVSLSRQRPPNIVVPPQSQISQRMVAYNPSEPSPDLDSSPPIPHGRRNVPAHISSGPVTPPMQPRPSIESRGPIARSSRIRTPSRDTTYMSIPQRERGLLIIGGSYREQTPYTSEFPPLLGIQNDRDRLRTAFQERQYSVETMVEEESDKTEILRRMGNFLASAGAGDIRMIVFTGHASKIGADQRFAIILSDSTSDDGTITSEEWQSTIIQNAGAGVVVISVFATCMSGAVAEQSVKLTNFDQIIQQQSRAPDAPAGPIQIILSSSGEAQLSFEYRTPPHRSTSGWHDYFLWALAETTQRPGIHDWESFVKTLQTTFTYVRTASFRDSSSFQYPQDLDWLLHNPQTPHIFVSSQMPDFNRFLPPQTH
ncbi:hypothetical protein FRC11_005533 [Ceratobasidium sp. 423]|nr:hypothetical protein FRC11_005533 [Ceratobasidium sp. 423]